MVHSIVLLLIFGGVVPCCICTPIVRGKYTELFRGYDLKQRIAYRIGQVECLMSLLQEDNALLGLGSLHRGNYSRDVSRFALKQRIAFLLGQLNCLKIHISLEPEPKPRFYLDCKDAYEQNQTTDGVYTINPDNQTAFQVYCDMTTDGGGWTMLQRRFDGSVDFNQNWTTCKNTFGSLTGEYWLGLINMHRLTASAPQVLRVDLEDFQNNTAYARYTTFNVNGASTNYRLVVSGYSGTAGDGLYYHSGIPFSTKDRNNDPNRRGSGWTCAVGYGSPWWYKNCYLVNLNGNYYHVQTTSSESSIRWRPWLRKNISQIMKKASMKIRRK